jgi:two-component system sensor histidine kinase/response regulator
MTEKLEESIVNGVLKEVIETQLTEFEKVQSEMIGALVEAVPPEVQEPISALDISKAAGVLNQLNDLLRDDDSEASDVLDDNLDLLRFVLGLEMFQQVERAIKNFDFEKAFNLLKEHRETLNLLES